MTGFGSPCGACKFLRRKCGNGCIFAPYFSHEQGATHFSAIHKVFGASNVTKLLNDLPVIDRSEAAITISYEALARLQDPIYGCVSQIFALQQQVVSLQAQLDSLKELQATRNLINGVSPNNERLSEKFSYNSQDVQGWLQSDSSNTMMIPQFDSNISDNFGTEEINDGVIVNIANMGNNNHDRNETFGEENVNSFGIESFDQQYWCLEDHVDELESIVFGYHVLGDQPQH
ncbi:LOB domain-containing protein 29-like [Impatiens glandulifera]|uniref:LOB domain-containing protein 29-like n=1 Tax=Impatiens glandulifera TaxID=253017 RepID=UPI001FB0607F|nr:LOB domain-containing protein 29-like [Impatiens glandulifera]